MMFHWRDYVTAKLNLATHLIQANYHGTLALVNDEQQKCNKTRISACDKRMCYTG